MNSIVIRTVIQQMKKSVFYSRLLGVSFVPDICLAHIHTIHKTRKKKKEAE